jgi:hypothetical protein
MCPHEVSESTLFSSSPGRYQSMILSGQTDVLHKEGQTRFYCLGRLRRCQGSYIWLWRVVHKASYDPTMQRSRRSVKHNACLPWGYLYVIPLTYCDRKLEERSRFLTRRFGPPRTPKRLKPINSSATPRLTLVRARPHSALFCFA